MARILRAISVKQPFVELILRGLKRAEYRSRLTNIRERVYLYASLKSRMKDRGWRQLRLQPDDLPTGTIAGSVEIAGCRRLPGGNGFAYLLKNLKRLRRPLKPTNQPQPGIWRPQF